MISEIEIFIQLMQNLMINTSIVNSNSSDHMDLINIDLKLRDTFFSSFTESKLYEFISSRIESNTIYYVTDTFYCKYICLCIPTSNDKLIIGPYCNFEITQDKLLEIMESHHLQASEESSLRKYYNLVPTIQQENYLTATMNTLANILWENTRNYTVKMILLGADRIPQNRMDSTYIAPSSTDIDIEHIVRNYKMENDLIQIITLGQIDKLEQYIKSPYALISMEKRNADPLQNSKNYLIICNTILRKAAETGGVHPYYIDSVSRSFALKIDCLNTIHETNTLAYSMMRKYCLLVHNNSIKQYSHLIQHVIVLIDSDLSADLTLNTLADVCTVNASYLSTLFKKETGITLTSYVTKKRIDYSILLLNTTTLQIQTIATYCGIPDLNYFTKTFKKIIGMTPSQYRQVIHNIVN